MSKLLEELATEYRDSRPPEDAVTVRQLAKKIGKSVDLARDILDNKVENDGWKKQTAEHGRMYYWKPVD